MSGSPNGRHVTWVALVGILGAFFAFQIGILITGQTQFQDDIERRLDRFQARDLHSESELRSDMRSFQSQVVRFVTGEIDTIGDTDENADGHERATLAVEPDNGDGSKDRPSED